jgi:hypothetical protein
MKRVARGVDRSWSPAPAFEWMSMREYRYTVDLDGRIFHEGSEIIDPPVLRFFLRVMQQTPEGRYLAICQGEQNWFEAADTPFVIQRLQCNTEEGRLLSAEIFLAGDYHEPLDPDTLEAEAGYLYCRVRGRTFRARFGRSAVQQLAPFLVESEGGPTLTLGGVRHRIHQVQPVR